jgi:hypothetical protein
MLTYADARSSMKKKQREVPLNHATRSLSPHTRMLTYADVCAQVHLKHAMYLEDEGRFKEVLPPRCYLLESLDLVSSIKEVL